MAGGSRGIDGVREQTGDPAIDRAQTLALRLAEESRACPFTRGKVKKVRLTAGAAKTVAHRLGVPAAFLVIRGNHDGTGVAAEVVESATTYQSPLDLANQLSVVASANCLVDLWFYPRIVGLREE